MTLQKEMLQVIRKLNRVGTDLSNRFSQRELAIELMKLAVVSREHVLLLGPPGSGKSELIARFAAQLRARSFQYLLTRFTEPAELFGPLDLELFKTGEYRVRTARMLPEAEIAFLDEVFQASSAILNTLLSLVHERQFFNGATIQKVPLLTLFAASNSLPDDPTLSAFSDRFALRLEIAPVSDALLPDLLDKGWALELDRMSLSEPASDALLHPPQLAALHQELARVDAKQLLPIYYQLIANLRAEGLTLSERRMVKGLKLVRAAALLAERDVATAADLWPLNHIWSHPNEAPVLQKLVQPHVDKAGGPKFEKQRSIEDLVDELELLESTPPPATSDGAAAAHLSSLARIRRELITRHAQETELIQRVQTVIGTRLRTMELS